MPHPFFDVLRPVVIGHRGAAGTHPENTLASFAAALELGAQILESDVHLTRDGVPVLLHDPRVDRVTEAQGLASDLTWDELCALDAGYHFENTTGGHPARGRGHRIPSLEQAFERFPEARFNLEIKSDRAAAIQTTLDLVERFDRSDRTLLAAGEDDVMRELRAALAKHPAEPAMGASLGEIVAGGQERPRRGVGQYADAPRRHGPSDPPGFRGSAPRNRGVDRPRSFPTGRGPRVDGQRPGRDPGTPRPRRGRDHHGLSRAAWRIG